MKEINAFEMEQVSGAGLMEMLNGSQGIIEGIADIALGTVFNAAATAAWGSVIGGYYAGSSGGGMLGVGVFGTIVGWGAGVLLGGIFGALNGAYHGMSAAQSMYERVVNDFTSGSWVA